MENETHELDLEIGTKEPVTLKSGTVKVVDVTIDEVNVEGKAYGKKVNCFCKHPDREETIIISGIKHEVAGKLKVVGAWLGKDEDGKISKKSALASLLKK